MTVDVVERDHVGPRHHHLAGDGVAELDDALDQLALLVLDHLVVGGGLDDAEQLLLGDERALLQAPCRGRSRWSARSALARSAATAGTTTSAETGRAVASAAFCGYSTA